MFAGEHKNCGWFYSISQSEITFQHYILWLAQCVTISQIANDNFFCRRSCISQSCAVDRRSKDTTLHHWRQDTIAKHQQYWLAENISTGLYLGFVIICVIFVLLTSRSTVVHNISDWKHLIALVFTNLFSVQIINLHLWIICCWL